MTRKRPYWRHPKWTKAHRWITLLVGVQLLLWISSGLIFVFNDIDNVHGDFEFKKPEAVPLAASSLEPRALAALRALEKSLDRALAPTAVSLTRRLDRQVFAIYENGSTTAAGFVDARTAVPLGLITASEAAAAARAHFQGDSAVRAVALLEEAPSEYRGRPLPVYRVDFSDAKETAFYVSPQTGEVVARRNWNWRLFDFFWMLHTMDYWGRDDFNHWLIRFCAVLAAVAGVSGIVLLGQRFVPGRKGSKLTTTRRIS